MEGVSISIHNNVEFVDNKDVTIHLILKSLPLVFHIIKNIKISLLKN